MKENNSAGAVRVRTRRRAYLELGSARAILHHRADALEPRNCRVSLWLEAAIRQEMGSQQTPSNHIKDNAQAGASHNLTWLQCGGIPGIEPSDAHDVCWVHGPQVQLHQHLRAGSVPWLGCCVETRQAANQFGTLRHISNAKPCQDGLVHPTMAAERRSVYTNMV